MAWEGSFWRNFEITLPPFCFYMCNTCSAIGHSHCWGEDYFPRTHYTPTHSHIGYVPADEKAVLKQTCMLEQIDTRHRVENGYTSWCVLDKHSFTRTLVRGDILSSCVWVIVSVYSWFMHTLGTTQVAELWHWWHHYYSLVVWWGMKLHFSVLHVEHARISAKEFDGRLYWDCRMGWSYYIAGPLCTVICIYALHTIMD